MLPEFPKTASDLLKYAAMRIDMQRKALAPITDIGIQTVAHEGRAFSYEQEGAGVVRDSYEEFATRVEVKFDEIPSLTGQVFEAKLETIANEQAKQMSKFVYSRMDDILTKAGTGVDAGGQPLSKEILLKMLEGMQVSFDESGQPDLTFFAHPTMAEEMDKRWREWTEDAEFMATYRNLLNKKREEFFDRESNRKLAD
jgi:hypothetical protein